MILHDTRGGGGGDKHIQLNNRKEVKIAKWSWLMMEDRCGETDNKICIKEASEWQIEPNPEKKRNLCS